MDKTQSEKRISMSNADKALSEIEEIETQITYNAFNGNPIFKGTKYEEEEEKKGDEYEDN